MGLHDPAEEALDAAQQALSKARAFVQDYQPELVVLFAPDHFNGFLYNVLPQFCLGLEATAIGDYSTPSGPLNVPEEDAFACAEAVAAHGVDLAVSARMQVDHGFAQPLEVLFGALDAVPVIPVFVNAAGQPVGPIARSRVLGEGVGTFLASTGKRCLVIGSGGLSHDPPVPQLKGAPPEVVERLIHGIPSAEARAEREGAVLAVADEFAAGKGALRSLNPDFDAQFLDVLAGGNLSEIDRYENDWIVERGGRAAHEIRTWLAAFSALAAAEGPYSIEHRFYRPIPEWIAGFAVMTARGVSK